MCLCVNVCVKIHAQFAFHLFHLEMFSLVVLLIPKLLSHGIPSLPSIFFSLFTFIFLDLASFFVFKFSARRPRRCTLLFALLLINSFRKQIFTCMRSIEAIYIILVYECVWVWEWVCFLKEDIASIYNVSCLQHSLYTMYTVYIHGKLERHNQFRWVCWYVVSQYAADLCEFFSPLLLLLFCSSCSSYDCAVPYRMCCIKEHLSLYVCVCVQVYAWCIYLVHDK